MEIRTRPVVPAVTTGGSTGRRVDAYLSVLTGPPQAEPATAESVALIQQLTRREDGRPGPRRASKLVLLAPLKRIRRALFGGTS
ncbi:hypothetical protein [Allostreptomyces psammosilenae]|uniref:Uncharacterized protein n=1 Tax=Allostreptomyces psammosilenae TaxID=1892865 RepID=A0A852ZZT8_9ACTN|nr:hypothetical protein [Allostreptomyces psammosilenae]NYI04091.1 hypothetical protein [Allostreptomyces psammosilenae]